jgi:hypothetical protein
MPPDPWLPLALRRLKRPMKKSALGVILLSMALTASGISASPDARAGVMGTHTTAYAASVDGTVRDGSKTFPPPAPSLSAPIVGIAMHKAAYTQCYGGCDYAPFDPAFWLAASDGGVFAQNGAPFLGSAGDRPLNAPVVGIASLPDADGYWLVSSDGGIFAFGSARFYGSMGAIRLNKPVVGVASTSSGLGYWLVASDGGVFTFGDAKFFGSAAHLRLAAPIVAIEPRPSDGGYWMLGSDGGVFTFGDASFDGSGTGARSPAVALTARVSPVTGSFEPTGADSAGAPGTPGPRLATTRVTARTSRPPSGRPTLRRRAEGQTVAV